MSNGGSIDHHGYYPYDNQYRWVA